MQDVPRLIFRTLRFARTRMHNVLGKLCTVVYHETWCAHVRLTLSITFWFSPDHGRSVSVAKGRGVE